jgi:hypothetical protein
MESSLRHAFLDTVNRIVNRCMSDVESEARKYATVVNALAKQQPVDDLSTFRKRLSQVENAINEVTEDMDEMNERVNRVALAAEVPETVPEWESPSDFLSNTMDVVIDDKSTTIEGLQDLLEATIPEPSVATATATTTATALVKQEQEQEQEEEDEEEEEEDAVELKEFQHNGKTYFKDLEENVFQDADDEVPVGRWIEKKQTIKFYTRA